MIACYPNKKKRFWSDICNVDWIATHGKLEAEKGFEKGLLKREKNIKKGSTLLFIQCRQLDHPT